VDGSTRSSYRENASNQGTVTCARPRLAVRFPRGICRAIQEPLRVFVTLGRLDAVFRKLDWFEQHDVTLCGCCRLVRVSRTPALGSPVEYT
jgi:hypothetical protein